MKPDIKTLGDLKKSGYHPRTIKEELRTNLILTLKGKTDAFKGILGYEDSVIPDLQRAILSRHNMILLGLRGQAKTRIARLMIDLLDEYMPIIEGSEIHDDPMNPISRYGFDKIRDMGDETPVAWVHRNERFTEKLATPDVSVADLIGDADPIKAANLKLPYSDERVIHFGLVPRSHRGIFVINELPDLQPRIQVSLFNILQEGDIQIRGFKLRLPLDIQFVFTANPEDYTNRGSIVTPLKDRIQSQILTHYPKTVEISKEITRQEAKLHPDQRNSVRIPALAEDLIEQIAFEARGSEYVDAKSGVSARLTISAYENLISTAERRALINGEKESSVRVSDFWGIIPAITGKIELVYEGEQEGPGNVAQILVGKSIRTLFTSIFPEPDNQKKKKKAKENPYELIVSYFGSGNTLDILNDCTQNEYQAALNNIPGLKELVQKYHSDASKSDKLFLMEFALHGLAEYSLISKSRLERGLQFRDLLSGMFTMPAMEEDEY